jgi:hypothetical protein
MMLRFPADLHHSRASRLFDIAFDKSGLEPGEIREEIAGELEKAAGSYRRSAGIAADRGHHDEPLSRSSMAVLESGPKYTRTQ